ncbi:hypothetical protein Poli38472_001115 [Pythium oligandrum]|uniref:NAD(P)-binding protein n=1 Tax=Pythium oligandrum TaxID=41045 RepID=A0A8K1CTH9_PYTOL|nr:hypothetical protein Poli38472_001115 [Pythium oligandrum]|eukprot:TMW68959.1 hypothetical protein Poli38472_001115 [Pythium oligandrum]
MSSPTKTILITGASRGIGLALVEQYQKDGWNVIAAVRNVQTADKLQALAPYKIVSMDTSDEASILKAAEELKDQVIDVLINNAGIARNDTIESATRDSILDQFIVNTLGPFLVTRALLPNLRAAAKAQGTSVVAQVSSVLGSITGNWSGGLFGYRCSKAGVNMVNANYAIALKDDNIIALALHPGYVSTDMTGNEGSVTPAATAAGFAKVIAGATMTDSGKFIKYNGKELPCGGADMVAFGCLHMSNPDLAERLQND